jgi:hypothetical protein
MLIQLPLKPMKKEGYYIFILLILFMYLQGMFVSLSMQNSSYHSFKFLKQGKSVLSCVSESPGKILHSETNGDFANLAFVDFDRDYEDSLSLLKKNLMGKSIFNKHTQSVFVLLHSYTRGKYQFPYLFITSTPRFIALRAIII